MHPAISMFPSQKFYKGKLLNDVSVKERIKDADFLRSFIGQIFKEYGPVNFFDKQNSKEVNREGSKANIEEALQVVSILRNFEQIINKKFREQEQLTD